MEKPSRSGMLVGKAVTVSEEEALYLEKIADETESDANFQSEKLSGQGR